LEGIRDLTSDGPRVGTSDGIGAVLVLAIVMDAAAEIC
jgi:hypothetical protein